jgi:hypothetical protein
MSDQAPICQLATLLEEIRRQEVVPIMMIGSMHAPDKARGAHLLSWVAFACLERDAAALSGLRREWAELIGVRTERTALKVLQLCIEAGWLHEEREARSQGGVVKTYRPGPKLLEEWNCDGARQFRSEMEQFWRERAAVIDHP